MAGPRLVQKAIAQLPEPLSSLFEMIRLPGSVIADATATSLENNTLASSTTSFAQNTSIAGASAMATSTPELAEGFLASLSQILGLKKLSNLDGVFSYLFSRWAVSTFLIVGRFFKIRNVKLISTQLGNPPQSCPYLLILPPTLEIKLVYTSATSDNTYPALRLSYTCTASDHAVPDWILYSITAIPQRG